jgi:hypothetical protein
VRRRHESESVDLILDPISTRSVGVSWEVFSIVQGMIVAMIDDKAHSGRNFNPGMQAKERSSLRASCSSIS